ncbi:MAG: hypothetical protein IT431_01805 [Phycisphaerales bacterium]|nr:hypothetical protein [Phycisphaerales bacterium]
MTNRLWRLAGLSASVFLSAPASAQRTPQLLQHATEVTPLQIAPAICTGHGGHMTGDWIGYPSGAGEGDPVFDCYGDDDLDGVPDDASWCALGAARWYFGSGFCNMFVTNDMTVDPNTFIADGIWRADLAWYWTCGGSGTSERCIIGVFTQESNPCEPDSLDYTGWLIDFGTLPACPGGYYHSTVDITDAGEWNIPVQGRGSYLLYFLQAVSTSGCWVLASCAQPMLWATGDARGDPDAPGTQGPLQFDDDSPPDGFHDQEECRDYALGACLDPLGAMARFWGHVSGPPCFYIDCNRDYHIDITDFLCYLNLWVVKDPYADFDRNGLVDSRDIIFFLGLWADCQ